MFVLKAFLFGVTLAAAVGPIALLIVDYGIRSGFIVALRSGLGAALADLTFAMAALFAGASILRVTQDHEHVVRTIASATLILLGLWMIRRSTVDAGVGAQTKSDAERPLTTTYLLTMINPMTVVLFMGFLPHLPDNPDPVQVALAVTALFAGSLFVQTGFALGGAGLRRWIVDGRRVRQLNAMSALGVIAFGIAGLF